MSKDEVWRDVLGYDGRYQVSNKGNVRSVTRKDSVGRKISGIILKPISLRDGYLYVSLCKNGKVKTKSIHRLVLEAFVENPNNLPEVNHKDENKINNELSNLEWCDARYNNNYGTRIERVSKKVRAVNVETGEVVTFNSTAEAGRKGYAQSGVAAACKGVYKDSKTGKLIGGDGRTYKDHRWYYMEEGE